LEHSGSVAAAFSGLGRKYDAINSLDQGGCRTSSGEANSVMYGLTDSRPAQQSSLGSLTGDRTTPIGWTGYATANAPLFLAAGKFL
jgi:hypothetical protein